jgi:hypothetical protein
MADLAQLKAEMTANQIPPVKKTGQNTDQVNPPAINQNGQEGGNVNQPQVDPATVHVFTPDGQTDPVRTSLARQRLMATQGDNQPSSEPTPPETVQSNSQPVSGTEVPPAPVASPSKPAGLPNNNPLEGEPVPSGMGNSDVDAAKSVLTSEGKLGVSLLQRRANLPYARAVAAISELEKSGEIVRPDPAGPWVKSASETNSAGPIPSQTDLDEQDRLETAQDSIGLSKPQAARLTELQARNKTSAPPADASEETRAEQPQPGERGQSVALGGPKPPVPADVAATNPPQKPPSVKVAKAFAGTRRFEGEAERFGPDLLDYIADNGGMMSKSAARRELGAAKFKQNASLWDDAPQRLAAPHHNVIYGGSRLPDQIAQSAYDAGKISEPTTSALWAEIHDASQKRQANWARAGEEQRAVQTMADEHQRWKSATEQGAVKVAPEQLSVGDHLDVDGEHVKVVDKDEDGSVTVQDGRKFGTQMIRPGESVYVQKWDEGENPTKYAVGDSHYGVEPLTQQRVLNGRKIPQYIDNEFSDRLSRMDPDRAKGIIDLAEGIFPKAVVNWKSALGKLRDYANEMEGESTSPQEQDDYATLLDYAKGKAGDNSRFGTGDAVQRGLAEQPVTDAIKGLLGTTELPAGIRVIRDESAPWGAKIEGRNNIVVNAAQVSTPERARQVIMEEGWHGVWHDPAVQRAWEDVRKTVNDGELAAEFQKRKAQGLPTDPATIREEAAIARLVKADASRGAIARVLDAARGAFKRIFGFDLPGSSRQQLRDAALEFLRNRKGWQGAKGEFSVPPDRQLGQTEMEGMPGQRRLFSAGAESQSTPKLLDIRRANDEISTGAAKEFASWPERVTAADGSDILLKNPEGGSLGRRVKHLIWDSDLDRLAPQKAQWLPNVPETLRNADARLRDPDSGNRVYVHTYADGSKHMVVVRPDGVVEDQKPFSGKLITQFKRAHGGRQDDFETEWKKGDGQSHGNPAPTPTGSKLRDTSQSAFQGENTSEGDDVKHAAGDAPERERTVDQIQSDIATAEDGLKAKISQNSDRPAGMARNVARSQYNIAYSKLKHLKEEMDAHPDEIATRTLARQAAMDAMSKILDPHGIKMRPDQLPELSHLSGKLSPKELNQLADLRNVFDQANDGINRAPKKLAARIYSELQDQGKLPKAKSDFPENPGRTLDKMTDFLRQHESDSPKPTFAERLALGKKFAATVEGAKDAFSKAWLNSQAAWKAFVETYKGPPVDDDYRSAKKSWISYDQQTSREGYEAVKALQQKVPLPVRRAGITAWLDANGDQSLLKFQRDAVPEQYRTAWDAALKLTPGEKRIALQIKADFAAKLEDAQAYGLIDKGRSDYGAPQRWKTPPQVDPDPTAERQSSAGNPFAKLDTRSPFFSLRRTVPSYFEGIMRGGVPENLDISHLASVYDEAFHKTVGSRGFVGALQDAKAADGKPVAIVSGSAASKLTPDGRFNFVDSRSRPEEAVTADGRPYRALDHPSLTDWKFRSKDASGNPIIVKGQMLIHPDHFRDVKNELETPRWTTEGAGAFALKASAFLKASKFIGPFHMVTEALHASFHGVVPSVHDFQIDFNDPKQAALARNMSLGGGKAREMFEDGLSSQKGIWAHVPGLGDAVTRMNNFMFNEYIPRLKMKVGLAVLDRNTKRYSGDLNPEQIAEVTGRQMDAAFGGQNWRLMGTSKNVLAALRLGVLTPDFTLSRAKVIGQAFKPYNAEQRIFLLAQAAGVYALSRVANMAFSQDHDPHMELRNWDSVVIGKRAYHARFIVSDAANFARDMLGLNSFKSQGIPFINSRLGVAPKTAAEALTGRDLSTGQPKDGRKPGHPRGNMRFTTPSVQRTRRFIKRRLWSGRGGRRSLPNLPLHALDSLVHGISPNVRIILQQHRAAILVAPQRRDGRNGDAGFQKMGREKVAQPVTRQARDAKFFEGGVHRLAGVRDW